MVMKASEMISKLQKLLDEHGDNEIHSEASWGEYVEDVIFDSGYSGGMGRYLIIDSWVAEQTKE
jgi:hypothetical protein